MNGSVHRGAGPVQSGYDRFRDIRGIATIPRMLRKLPVRIARAVLQYR